MTSVPKIGEVWLDAYGSRYAVTGFVTPVVVITQDGLTTSSAAQVTVRKLPAFGHYAMPMTWFLDGRMMREVVG